MARWIELQDALPDLTCAAFERFTVRRHATLATLRSDGSPRISGTEVDFVDGDVRLGCLPRSVKALDLRRDGRLALHSPTIDPPADDPSAWPGEAKLAGIAHELSQSGGRDEAHVFWIDIKELVLTGPDEDELVINSWHEGRGVRVRRRR